MKITIALVTLLFATPKIYTQQNLFSFKFQNSPLTEVLREVLAQSKMNFVYNPQIVPKEIRVTGTFKKITITQALDTFLKNTPIKYKLQKNNLILYKNTEEIREIHRPSKPIAASPSKNERYFIVDTVIYSIISHDTVITTLTEYEKIQVKDTIWVYDTIKVIKNDVTPLKLKGNWRSFLIGFSVKGGCLYSNTKSLSLSSSILELVNSAIQGKNSLAGSVNLSYRFKNFLLESGIGLQVNSYLFYFSYVDKETPEEAKHKYKSNLYYHYINFPIIGGYSYKFSKLAFIVRAGLMFDYYIGSKGDYLFSTDSKFNVDSKVAPEAKGLFGTFVSSGIEYSLSKKNCVHISPYFSWSKIPYQKTRTNYYHETKQLGLEVGINLFL